MSFHDREESSPFPKAKDKSDEFPSRLHAEARGDKEPALCTARYEEGAAPTQNSVAVCLLRCASGNSLCIYLISETRGKLCRTKAK